MPRWRWWKIARNGWGRAAEKPVKVMETRNYNKRQTKVRNVRNARNVSWRERVSTLRTRYAAWQDKRAERAENAENDSENEPPRFRWVKILGVLAAVACVTQLVYAAGLFEQYTVRTQHFHVAKFDVSGQKRVDRQAIIDASGVKPGASLTSLDPVVVQRTVEALPWVRTARVEAQLPSTLLIRIAEYQPFALLLSDTGKLLLVDRGGFVFKQADAGEAIDLPIITGLSAGLSRDVPVVDQHAAKGVTPLTEKETPTQRRLADLLRLIDAHAASPLAARFPLSEVHWDPVLGTTLISANDGTEIRLGHALETDLGRAFLLVGRLLDRIDRRGEWLQYALLDDDVRQDRAVVRALPLPDKPGAAQPGDELTQAGKAEGAAQVGAPAAAAAPKAVPAAQNDDGKAKSAVIKLPGDEPQDD
jgi:hypothetical protein